MDFFTSDLHFGHKKMMVAEDLPFRPWETMEEHDNGLIDAINAQATSMLDTIYIVGDLSFHKPKETADILNRIIARKVLVKGNHDNRTKNAEGARLASIVDVQLTEFHHYLERKFMVWRDLSDDEGSVFEGTEQLIVMNHFPMMHWHKQHMGSWQLHGHMHDTPAGVPGKIVDVGWDAWGRLVTLEDIDARMSFLPLRKNHHEGVGVQ